jgi:hypothetical protein
MASRVDLSKKKVVMGRSLKTVKLVHLARGLVDYNRGAENFGPERRRMLVH